MAWFGLGDFPGRELILARIEVERRMERQPSSQMFSAAADVEHWKAIYDRQDFLGDCYRQRMNQTLSWLDMAGMPGDAIVLDAGCGAGIVPQRIVERGYRVLGMDTSRAMIEEAHRVHDIELRPMSRFVQGDVECLPFAESSFSAVVCLGVVTYLRSAERALSELARVLEPKGTLILSVVNKAHLMHYLDLPEFVKLRLRKALGVNIPGARPTVRSYSVSEIMKSLRRHGFTVEDYAAVPLGLATFSGRAIPPVRLNARVTGLVARTRSIPLIGSLGGMCMFRARNGLGWGTECA